MISLILHVIAFLFFLIAGANGNLFGQGAADLVAFGLAAWVLATLLGGYGPASPLAQRSE